MEAAMRPNVIRLCVVAMLAASVATPSPAMAWRPYVGFYYGPGYYAPPPVYYAPPAYYYSPPPVAYSAPVPAYSAPAGKSCYAAAYVCPLDHAVAPGTSCSCPTNTGRAWGKTR
jgi:hypothetical protein